VPDGFVLPFAVHRAAADARAEASPLPAAVMEALEHALAQLGDPAVAVRSSAADEDTDGASAAGQYDSVLAVQGVADTAAAVRACWSSLHSSRATAYRTRFVDGPSGAEDLAMAVLVQRHLDANVSGVLFTPTNRGEATVIEASWGLGPSVVAGTVTPDTYRVHPNGRVTCVVADKRTRLDRGRPDCRPSTFPPSTDGARRSTSPPRSSSPRSAATSPPPSAPPRTSNGRSVVAGYGSCRRDRSPPHHPRHDQMTRT
jgi:pyruvate, water dikinase